MTQMVTKVWTYDDFLALPDDGNRYEIIEGVLYMAPPPTIGHQSTSSRLFLALGAFIQRHALGMLYHPPFEVHLSETTRPVQPDLVFIRTANLPSSALTHFEGVPDLVIEILSPSTQRNDRTVKYTAYEQAGIAEYWVVDPRSATVQVYVWENGAYVVGGEYRSDDKITSRVLVGLEIVNLTLFD